MSERLNSGSIDDNSSEEFLTRDDFRKINPNITDEEIEEINGHPMGDGDIRQRQRDCLQPETCLGSDITKDGLVGHDIFPRHTGKRKTIYIQQEFCRNSGRVDIIWDQYQEESLKHNSLNHIFLIPRGCIIEGKDRSRYRFGKVGSDILVEFSSNKRTHLKVMRFINPENSNIKYTDDYMMIEHTLSITKGIIIRNNCSRIDLTKIKNAGELRLLIEGSD